MSDVKEGFERNLTPGEIALARQIYGNTINYTSVKIHCGSYLPFAMQKETYAMAPNGELWFRKNGGYNSDFSMAEARLKHVFIHEMAHVWQRQKGMWVRLRGLFSWAVDYRYRLDGKKQLKDYGMEQQAAIIADYWLLAKMGREEWLSLCRVNRVFFLGVSGDDTMGKYQTALTDFFRQGGVR